MISDLNSSKALLLLLVLLTWQSPCNFPHLHAVFVVIQQALGFFCIHLALY